ncbi:SLC13 family permease [Hoeflea sp.]|uniref:SLC13 family permease n=1 Tax=Hoeflea sp. TaxID=1940281 RepID=UPI003B013109
MSASNITLSSPLFHYIEADIARALCRPIALIILCISVACAVWMLPGDVDTGGRIALAVTAFAIIGWTMTPVPDSVVAVSAALFLVLSGVVSEEQLYNTLGREIVWLLVAAFVIAAVVKTSGLLERFAFAAVRPFKSLTGFFHALAFVIATTAFLIPSTSGRAALLLPVFMALVDKMPGKAAERALALLFPTVILLSAGGSIIGAGAHLIAVETINRATGTTIGYLEWLMLAFPLTLLTSHIAVALILILFVPGTERGATLPSIDAAPVTNNTRQFRIACVLICIVALWTTAPWHGIDIALIAIGGAVLLLTGPFTAESPKQVFRKVEVELIIFLTATVVIADAMILSGTSKWMADAALDLLPQGAISSPALVIMFMALVAVLSHLVINSRSARVAVLLPALTLPLAGFGHDVITLALVSVLGTGFCQTMMASAKPVALFGNADRETFRQSDLIRLAIPLLPFKAGIIVAFALFVWPHQLDHDAIAMQPPRTAVISEAQAAGPITRAQEEPACTARHLRAVMMTTIRDKEMWAAGWWHVWDRLRRDGYPVERSAVRELYRGGDMVRLRSHSASLYAPDLAPENVAASQAACRIPHGFLLSPDKVPVPRKNPLYN